MALFIPSVGEDQLLKQMLGVSVPGNQTLKLYVNNVTIADASVAADFTEMTTLGYTAKTLTKTSWTVAQSGGVAEGLYAQQTWTFSAGTAVTVYGYTIVDSTSGVLLWAEAFATPKVVQFAGDQIQITPRFTLSKV